MIPTYHRNDLLAKCLDCLAPGVQTLPANQFEVIVTDDGAASTSEQMIQEQFPWAKWTQGPRRGPAANRNHGASLARSEWIAFTDDDCLPDPDWLKAFIKDTASGFSVLEGKTTCEEGTPSPMYSAPANESGGYLWSCNMALRREVFEGLSGFDEGFPNAAGEDVDFRERLADSGYRFKFVSEAVVDHPPRHIPGARRQVDMDESMFYLNLKRGRLVPRRDFLRVKFRSRAKCILKDHRLQIDSIKLAFHALSELYWTWCLYPSWVRKHGSGFPQEATSSKVEESQRS